MNYRPTPETDQIAESLLYERADKRDYEMRQYARRLERERDEAREECAKWHGMAIEADKRFVESVLVRDEWKAKYIQQNKDLGCEMLDPNGTIWDHAKKLQDENKALQEQLDAALMLGKMQERRHEREIEQVCEQYRLSSAYRRLLEDNKQLKGKA